MISGSVQILKPSSYSLTSKETFDKRTKKQEPISTGDDVVEPEDAEEGQVPNQNTDDCEAQDVDTAHAV